MATMSKVTLEDYTKFINKMKKIYSFLRTEYGKFVGSKESIKETLKLEDFYDTYSKTGKPAIQIAMLSDAYNLDETITQSPTFDSYIAKETNYINMVGAFERAIANGKGYKSNNINGLIVQNNFESNSNSDNTYNFKANYLADSDQNEIYALYKKNSFDAHNVQADEDGIVMGKIVVTSKDISSSESSSTAYSASYTREVGIYNGAYNVNKKYSKETISDGTVIRYCAPSKVKFQLVDENGLAVDVSDSELLTIQIKGTTLIKDSSGNVNSKEITENLTFTNGKSESKNYYFYVTNATVLPADLSDSLQKLNNYVTEGNFIKLTNIIETFKTQDSSSSIQDSSNSTEEPIDQE